MVSLFERFSSKTDNNTEMEVPVMSIRYVENNEDFMNIIKENPNVLVEFFATWCPHCKAFQPTLEQASEDLAREGVVVAQCDVDRLQDLAGEFGVEATPTIYFVKNGQPVLKSEGERDEEGIFEFVKEGEQA